MGVGDGWDRCAAKGGVAGPLGEEGETGGEQAESLAVRLGEGITAGALEGGGDVVPGGQERGTQQAGEHPLDKGQRGRRRGPAAGCTQWPRGIDAAAAE